MYAHKQTHKHTCTQSRLHTLENVRSVCVRSVYVCVSVCEFVRVHVYL